MTRYPCGCVNSVHPPTGALRSVYKCAEHAAVFCDPATLDEAYYRSNGALEADAPERYVRELTEALGPLPEPSLTLEIGCGVSPYFLELFDGGYHGIDLSRWAVDYMSRKSPVAAICADFATYEFDCQFGFILAAHAFEHMVDAPAAIAKAGRLLRPGGQLWIVVPDDSDPTNPDHLWTFSPDSLRKAVERAGLDVADLQVRRHIERENFLYLRATKP